MIRDSFCPNGKSLGRGEGGTGSTPGKKRRRGGGRDCSGVDRWGVARRNPTKEFVAFKTMVEFCTRGFDSDRPRVVGRELWEEGAMGGGDWVAIEAFRYGQ